MAKNNNILSVNNIPIENLGILKDFFRKDGYVVTEIDASTGMLPQNLEKYDAIFILGGPMSANDNYDYIQKEKILIKKAMDLGIPLMGICLGSQLIASVCGGSVYKGNKKEIGWHYVTINNEISDNIFSSIEGNRIEVFQWHGETFKLPRNAKILCTSDSFIQAFRINSAFGIQFHFEITKDMVLNWIDEYRDELDSEKVSQDELLDRVDVKIEKLNVIAETIYKKFISFMDKRV